MISLVMHAKTILSSTIPFTVICNLTLGLHLGSEIMIELKQNDTLELRPMRKDIKSFFGLGKNKTKNKIMSIEDMDKAICKAVGDNDRH